MSNGMKPFTDLVDSNGKPKIAPVQGYVQGIPWSLHLEAYDAYCKKWSRQEALIDLEGRGCRGGFSTGELDSFIPGWRQRVGELAQLQSEITKLRSELQAAQQIAAYEQRHAAELETELAKQQARQKTNLVAYMSEESEALLRQIMARPESCSTTIRVHNRFDKWHGHTTPIYTSVGSDVLSVAHTVNELGATVVISQHNGGVQTVLLAATHHNGFDGVALIELSGASAGQSKQHGIDHFKAENCTCPSGDGSLSWPCPSHPPKGSQA